MLPPMNPNGDDTYDVLKDELTDRAIETLYDIIRRAQTSAPASQPKRKYAGPSSSSAQPASPSSSALFNAYEQVLAEQGLQPSDDALLHRFLFRMQEARRHDEDIVQRFKRVLAEMNIQVEVDDEGEGVDVTSNLDNARDYLRNGAVAALGRHSRRGSFDSFFDGTADKIAGTDFGDLPVRTRRGSDALAGYRNPRRVRSDTEAQSYQHAHLPYRNSVNAYAHRRTASGQQPRQKRSASVSSRGSLQIRRDVPTGTTRNAFYDADESDHTDRTTSLDLSHIQVPGINAPIPDINYDSLQQREQYAADPFRPSDTRLLDEAETLEDQRLHRVTRDCIQRWRDRTQVHLARRTEIEGAAAAFDRKILLKLSFEQLRDTARLRQSSRETERFFKRLEERADRARNIFLLTKAFTHWAKSAEDEVQRTSVARRHILRTRFFNGWRDITAVNELKVQHFVLAKFLHKWRVRSASVLDNAQYAVQLYEDNLVRRVYKEWFFKFCAIAAPAWRNDRTRKITLHKMSEIAKVLRERQEWATDRWQRGVLHKTLRLWRERTATLQSLASQADDFRQAGLVFSALQTLGKQAELGPLLRQFQGRVRVRILRSTLQGWQHALQLSRQARSVDYMRILRNAYTAWNDRLRIKALEDRINDRVLVEALYKWTLASRVSLFQRVHDRQLKHSFFLVWVTKTNQRANTLDAAERRFAQFKRAQLLRTCLRKMEATTTEKKAEEFAVVAEYQQKLKQRIFDKLKERQAHFLQLKTWADAAHFYVLSKATLKTWSEATQHARRNRRRNTYAQIRRTVKTNLVRKLFANWRDKASHITQLNSQAEDVVVQRRYRGTGALIHQWHDRTIILRQQNTQATNLHAFKLEIRCLRIWSERTEVLQTMDAQAVALRQESAELAATSALKKLGWRLWNIQRQEENAKALYERNFEKHVRAIIRFWAEQMSERISNRSVSPTPTSRSRRSRRDDDDDDGDGGNDHERPLGDDSQDVNRDGFDETGNATRHLETWSAFDDNALGLNDDLDLSLSITPVHQRTLPPPASSARAPASRSILRPTPARPNTFPQQSALKPPPQTIPEDSILDPAFAFAANLDRDLADPETFWSSTPMAPLPTVSTLGVAKPGYLKTPSKRSVVRAKRPELPASPEKRERLMSPVRRNLGAMSAPPAQRFRIGTGGEAQVERAVGQGIGGMSSFQRRLRDEGFGRSMADTGGGGGGLGFGRGTARGRGKQRVGFGNVSQMG
ncbi:Sfi1 spindle body protein-domain-containing protein [Phaeosphaeria sp. MPI-PUGE-AT-0046c]|nr:Sfi1 spindle body protein-domain-containing protein [Phaeosphaeria sp. MPI-PUGE-AT-0046c]